MLISLYYECKTIVLRKDKDGREIAYPPYSKSIIEWNLLLFMKPTRKQSFSLLKNVALQGARPDLKKGRNPPRALIRRILTRHKKKLSSQFKVKDIGVFGLYVTGSE